MMISGDPVGPSAIFLTVFASMGGFLFGYDTGQIADILPMSNFLNRFGSPNPANPGEKHLTNTRSGLIVGLLSIGTLAGALIASKVADKFGRRNAMSFAAFMVSIGIVIQMTSFHVWQQFAMGRFTAGLGVGALSSIVPVYQSELAPKSIRGSLMGTYQLFITFGVLTAYCIGIGTRSINGAGSWRTLIGIGLIFAGVLGVGIQFMPESPRWLISRGRREEALAALARVRGVRVEENNAYVEHDYHSIIEALELDAKFGKGTWKECFERKLIKRTSLGIALQALQQLTGANFFLYYGATIFAGTGLNDSYVTQIILGVVNMVCTLPGLYALERYGRRKPLIFGGLWQSVWLLAFAIAGTVKDPTTNPNVGKFMIVATCFFLAGFSSTWGPGVWIQTGEMYPQRTRTKMQALSVSSNWIWNFLLAFFTPFITSDIGFSLGFVFAGCNLAGAMVVYFFVKEGAGLSLEQIQTMWEDKSTPAWQSASWVPPGYAHRRDALEANKNDAKPSAPAPFPALNEKKDARNVAAQAQHREHMDMA